METARHDLLAFAARRWLLSLSSSNLRRHPRWAAPNKHGGLTRAPQTRACLATPREDGAQAAGCTDASGSTPASVDRPVFDLNKVYTKWLRAWCAGRNGDQHRGLGLGNPRARNTGARLRRHASPRLDGCTFYMHSRECALLQGPALAANLMTTLPVHFLCARGLWHAQALGADGGGTTGDGDGGAAAARPPGADDQRCVRRGPRGESSLASVARLAVLAFSAHAAHLRCRTRVAGCRATATQARSQPAVPCVHTALRC